MKSMMRVETIEDDTKANMDLNSVHVDQEEIIKDPLFQEFE